MTEIIKINKWKLITLTLVVVFFSCDSKRKYSDYNESDFYEVQGIINYANPDTAPFNSYTIKNISYTYFLDRENPKIGIEKNLDMSEAQKGLPLIVLVHKSDENISFYGRVGILDTLTEKEIKFMDDRIKKILLNTLN